MYSNHFVTNNYCPSQKNALSSDYYPCSCWLSTVITIVSMSSLTGNLVSCALYKHRLYKTPDRHLLTLTYTKTLPASSPLILYGTQTCLLRQTTHPGQSTGSFCCYLEYLYTLSILQADHAVATPIYPETQQILWAHCITP